MIVEIVLLSQTAGLIIAAVRHGDCYIYITPSFTGSSEVLDDGGVPMRFTLLIFPR